MVLLALWFLTAPFAHAGASLEQGGALLKSTDCGSNLLSSVAKLCELIDKAGAGCEVVQNTCGEMTRELFAGTDIELATPKNIKIWNGLGGLGVHYNTALSCLMRDVLDLPGKAFHTSAETKVFGARAEQEVGVLGFDPKTADVFGYHRLKACGPAVGCLDVVTQKFSLHPVSSSVLSKGWKAGQYEIRESFASQLWADGVAQEFKTVLPSILVPTPIGPVSVKPRFKVQRAMGPIVAPFDGSQRSSLPSPKLGDSENHTYDVYGRLPGAAISTLSPLDTKLDDPDYKYSQKAWLSTVALGGRDPHAKIWTPANGVEFPNRPDLDPKIPRSKLEKTPGAAMEASAYVEYSIADKLPAALTKRLGCSGFVSLCLNESNVFAEPAFDLLYSSQLSFFQNEQSHWNEKTGSKEFSTAILTPDRFNQARDLQIRAHTSATASSSLRAGFNLVIHLSVGGFPGIDKDIVKLRPRMEIPLFSETAHSSDAKADPIASARSLGSQVLAQKKIFQDYTSWDGVNRALQPGDGGLAAIQACLKTPAVEKTEPPAPTYEPGDPNVLLDAFEQPCNICVAWSEIPYTDENNKAQVEPGGTYVVFPTPQKGIPLKDQWVCGGTAQLGCYDLCQVSASGARTVKHSAEQLIAMHADPSLPKSCRPSISTTGGGGP